jgi:hypothetical protein
MGVAAGSLDRSLPTFSMITQRRKPSLRPPWLISALEIFE